MFFEWDSGKSAHTHLTRGLPFDLAVFLFDNPVLEQIDDRKNNGESRVRAIGMVGDLILCCVYTDRLRSRRIISLRLASRKERDAYGSTYPL